MNPRLRALLRVLVFVLFAFVVLPAKARWLRHVFHGADDTARYLVDHGIELGAVLLYAAIAAAVERRPFASYGLPWREALRSRFWQGAAAGLASIAVLVLALVATGALRVGVSATSLGTAIGFGLGYALVFVLLALREEFLYRGYGLFTLAQLVGFWPAAVAASAWFTNTHAGVSSESTLGLVSVALFGLFGCLLLRRTGNLWMVIGFHAAWNWGQTCLFGAGDSGHAAAPGHLLTSVVSPHAPAWLSGGKVGPEGSVLCWALLTLVGSGYAWLLRGVRYPAPAERTAAAPAQA